MYTIYLKHLTLHIHMIEYSTHRTGSQGPQSGYRNRCLCCKCRPHWHILGWQPQLCQILQRPWERIKCRKGWLVWVFSCILYIHTYASEDGEQTTCTWEHDTVWYVQEQTVLRVTTEGLHVASKQYCTHCGNLITFDAGVSMFLTL